MELLRYAEEEPQRVLAVTDSGQLLHYGEIKKAAAALPKEAGHRLVFLLCSNSP